MKRRLHWTVYAVFVLALLTIAAVTVFWLNERKISRFENAITEAGGAVHYDMSRTRSFEIGGLFFELSDRDPVAVEISSGSHPIPESLNRLHSMKTVKKLSLNTSAVGDYLVPVLGTFRYLTILDLTKTEISAGAVIQILEDLPGLKNFQVSRDNFSEEELSHLLSHRLAAKLILGGSVR